MVMTACARNSTFETSWFFMPRFSIWEPCFTKNSYDNEYKIKLRLAIEAWFHYYPWVTPSWPILSMTVFVNTTIQKPVLHIFQIKQVLDSKQWGDFQNCYREFMLRLPWTITFGPIRFTRSRFKLRSSNKFYFQKVFAPNHSRKTNVR